LVNRGISGVMENSRFCLVQNGKGFDTRAVGAEILVVHGSLINKSASRGHGSQLDRGERRRRCRDTEGGMEGGMYRAGSGRLSGGDNYGGT
jgi:hypothetical protein